jgi:hypothetical protein
LTAAAVAARAGVGGPREVLVSFPAFLAMTYNQLWHLLPLVVAISLVYGATRHELMGPILGHAWRFGLWVLTFVAIIFAVLYVISTWVV